DSRLTRNHEGFGPRGASRQLALALRAQPGATRDVRSRQAALRFARGTRDRRGRRAKEARYEVAAELVVDVGWRSPFVTRRRPRDEPPTQPHPPGLTLPIPVIVLGYPDRLVPRHRQRLVLRPAARGNAREHRRRHADPHAHLRTWVDRQRSPGSRARR